MPCLQFECDLCDAGYVGFTCRHLHQRVEEHKNSSSSICKHFQNNHSLAPKDLTMNFSLLKSAQTNLTVLSMRCFLFTTWDLLSMYNLTQFVLRILICFLLVFSLHVFIVHLHLQKFLYFLCAYNLYIFILLFYHTLDNDWSTVETSCFSVSFYH